MTTESNPRVSRPRARRAPRPPSDNTSAGRAEAVWTAGNFLQIARSYEAGATVFIDRLALRPGESVLDVACGTGNLAIPAARAGAIVCGIDIAPNLIDEARLSARAANCTVQFEVGNAEALPYGQDQFDTTVSMFGAMFAYRPERVAAELIRVTRPGGRVAMANWTPASVIADMLRAHVAVVPPAAGLPSPLAWGDEEVVRDRFRSQVDSLTCTKRMIELRFPFPPAEVTDLFANYYGPTVTTLRAADADGGRRLRTALTALFEKHNQATDGTTTIVGEYLDVQARVA